MPTPDYRDTKFDLGELVQVPFDDEWFAPAPNKKGADHPKRGELNLKDPAIKRKFQSAVTELNARPENKKKRAVTRPGGAKK